MLDPKVKRQGHMVKNAKTRSSGRCKLCTLSSAQNLVTKTLTLEIQIYKLGAPIFWINIFQKQITRFC